MIGPFHSVDQSFPPIHLSVACQEVQTASEFVDHRVDAKLTCNLSRSVTAHSVCHGQQHAWSVNLRVYLNISCMGGPRAEVEDQKAVLVGRALPANIRTSGHAQRETAEILGAGN